MRTKATRDSYTYQHPPRYLVKVVGLYPTQLDRLYDLAAASTFVGVRPHNKRLTYVGFYIRSVLLTVEAEGYVIDLNAPRDYTERGAHGRLGKNTQLVISVPKHLHEAVGAHGVSRQRWVHAAVAWALQYNVTFKDGQHQFGS